MVHSPLSLSTYNTIINNTFKIYRSTMLCCACVGSNDSIWQWTAITTMFDTLREFVKVSGSYWLSAILPLTFNI